MDEIRTINTVEELKKELVKELGMQANSFVRTGYLLKMARDTDILKDSGYADIYDFAMKEFGLDSSYVSRYIHINDRFSEGGYSERLRAEYEGYGYSKLSIMLTLPDELNAELSPEYSKSEINTIKTEYEAEQKISDLEVMMEEKEDGPDEFVAMIVKELNDEHPDAAIYLNDTMKLAAKLGTTVNDADIMEAYIPDGVATYSIRIPGQGRFMVSMKPEGITILNMRDPENKSPLTWQEFKDVLLEDMKARDFPKEKKEKKKDGKVKPAKPKDSRYVEEVKKYHEQQVVAPVQPENVQKSSENVQKSSENVQKEPEKTKNDQNLPFPEVMPEEKQPEPQSDEEHPAAGVEKVEGEEFTPEDQVIEELHDSIRNLEDQIIARNWTRALIYVEDIEFRIKRMKGV